MPSRRLTRHAELLRAVPWSAEDFDARYQSHQQRALARFQRRRRKPLSATAQARLATLTLDLREAIALAKVRARERRAGSHERLLDGFVWAGGYVNGRRLAPLIEHRLRSPLHPMLRLFVAATPRAPTSLRAGHAKDQLLAFGSKLVLLDHAYVNFNARMRGIIRVDLDKPFASWDALREAIQGTGLPPPNLAVAHVEADGRVVNPHAYWLLAQAVCCTAQGRGGPQRLLGGITRAMVDTLGPIGADPGGLSNPLSGKNPLSPLWSCQVMSATPFNLTNGKGAQPGLTALADYVCPTFLEPEASPAAREIDVSALLKQSNGLFEVLKRFTFAQVIRFHPRGRGEGDFEDFARATVAYALDLPTARLRV